MPASSISNQAAEAILDVEAQAELDREGESALSSVRDGTQSAAAPGA